MRKSFIAAAILAAASSFAVAQTTAPMNNGPVVNEGAAATSGTMDGTMAKTGKHTGKSSKSSKKMDKSSGSAGSSGAAGTTGSVTGTTGTTAAGTADQTTSGATKPAGDASMKH